MTILEEAQELVYGDRQAAYGSVNENFGNIAALFEAYLKIPVTVLDVANLMILVKVARTKRGYHHDSYVDIAGYAGTAAKAQDELAEAAAAPNQSDFSAGEDLQRAWEALVNPNPAPRVWDSILDVPVGVAVLDRDNGKFVVNEDGTVGFETLHGVWSPWGSPEPWFDQDLHPFTEVVA